MVLSILFILAAIAGAFYLFFSTLRFGRYASGQQLERIKQSPNFYKGQFQNLSPTPSLKEGVSMVRVMKEFFFNKSKQSLPAAPIPTVKTDLHSIPTHENVMVWFGHSSYFLQVDGKRILVDPVFSGNASPVKFTTKSYEGTNVYTTDDIPPIDLLIITHDHWDHLDYKTVMYLRPKIKKVITGLGVGAHLIRWGFSSNIIEERDWNETVELNDGFTIYTTPSRHFSGRGIKRNRSLWMSYVLQTPNFKIYIGGDSGYDTHFKKIGETFGPFDIAILECGQYNEYWKYIHMMPEEVVQAAIDLKAAAFIPIHWSKFSLALHAWNDPIIRVTDEADRQKVNLKTGLIGEKISLTSTNQINYWWTKI